MASLYSMMGLDASTRLFKTKCLQRNWCHTPVVIRIYGIRSIFNIKNFTWAFTFVFQQFMSFYAIRKTYLSHIQSNGWYITHIMLFVLYDPTDITQSFGEKHKSTTKLSIKLTYLQVKRVFQHFRFLTSDEITPWRWIILRPKCPLKSTNHPYRPQII